MNGKKPSQAIKLVRAKSASGKRTWATAILDFLKSLRRLDLGFQ